MQSITSPSSRTIVRGEEPHPSRGATVTANSVLGDSRLNRGSTTEHYGSRPVKVEKQSEDYDYGPRNHQHAGVRWSVYIAVGAASGSGARVRQALHLK